MFIVGSELALVPNANPGLIPAMYTLLTRFFIMPGVSLLFVLSTAGRGWYTDDKLVWYEIHFYLAACSVLILCVRRFLLVLIPAGPSAMLLANIAELVQVDIGPVSGYLTISVRCALVSGGGDKR